MKGYFCPICGRFFSNIYRLRNHYQKEHLDVDNVCPVCGKHLSSIKGLKIHLALISDLKHKAYAFLFGVKGEEMRIAAKEVFSKPEEKIIVKLHRNVFFKLLALKKIWNLVSIEQVIVKLISDSLKEYGFFEDYCDNCRAITPWRIIKPTGPASAIYQCIICGIKKEYEFYP